MIQHLSSDSFRIKKLKTELFAGLLNTLSAVEMLHESVQCKFTIDIDIDIDREGFKPPPPLHFHNFSNGVYAQRCCYPAPLNPEFSTRKSLKYCTLI